MSREGDGEICVVYNWLYAALCCVLYAASSDSRVVKQLVCFRSFSALAFVHCVGSLASYYCEVSTVNCFGLDQDV